MLATILKFQHFPALNLLSLTAVRTGNITVISEKPGARAASSLKFPKIVKNQKIHISLYFPYFVSYTPHTHPIHSLIYSITCPSQMEMILRTKIKVPCRVFAGLTEADVKLLLAKQEEELVTLGVSPLHEKWNASVFIITGLGLEELQ